MVLNSAQLPSPTQVPISSQNAPTSQLLPQPRHPTFPTHCAQNNQVLFCNPTSVISRGFSSIQGSPPPVTLHIPFLGSAITKARKLGGFRQQRFALSQFWRLAICNQGHTCSAGLGEERIASCLASGGGRPSLVHLGCGYITPSLPVQPQRLLPCTFVCLQFSRFL